MSAKKEIAALIEQIKRIASAAVPENDSHTHDSLEKLLVLSSDGGNIRLFNGLDKVVLQVLLELIKNDVDTSYSILSLKILRNLCPNSSIKDAILSFDDLLSSGLFPALRHGDQNVMMAVLEFICSLTHGFT